MLYWIQRSDLPASTTDNTTKEKINVESVRDPTKKALYQALLTQKNQIKRHHGTGQHKEVLVKDKTKHYRRSYRCSWSKKNTFNKNLKVGVKLKLLIFLLKKNGTNNDIHQKWKLCLSTVWGKMGLLRYRNTQIPE